jgi:Ca-activated chloride channel family protein
MARMIGWKWADPSQIVLLLLVLGLALGWYWVSRIQAKKMKTLSNPRAISFLFQEVSKKKFSIRRISWLLGLIFLVLALMRLQSPGGKIEIRSEGIEIMLIADVSESMMAEDLRPNRLSQMKYDLARFVDLLGGHQVGLVAFAGSAHLLSPLTSDPNALKMYIDSLTPLSVSSQGTNVGAALEVGLEAFERGGKQTNENAKVTRAFVLFSDGEDHEPETLNKIKKVLSEKDIRIFSLAYGTEAGVTIPDRDSLGYLRGQKRNRKGEVIVTKVNGDFLKSLAEAGGGEFDFAIAGGDQIKKIISAINKLEKRVNQTESAISYNEHFAVFAWLSFFHFLIALLLPLKKQVNTKWLGRVVPVILILLTQESAMAGLKTLRGWYHYHKALKHISKEDSGKAFSELSQALIYDPESSEVHNAFGTLFSKSEQWEKALSSFSISEKLAQSPEEQFSARFNQGVVYQAQKQVDPALEAYLKALEIKPDSRETKINIELLMQQMQGKGKGEGDNSKEDQDGQKDPNQDPQRYQQSKPQPKKFQSEDLSEADMKRILDELRNQEQKIRTEYNKKEQKEKPRDKDW